MNTPRDLDRALPAWLDAQVSSRIPAYVDELLAETAAAPQRPRWTFPARWLGVEPSSLITARQLLVGLLLLGLLAAVALAAAFVGARRVAPPFGLVRPGLVAWDSQWHIFSGNADGTLTRQLTAGDAQDSSPVFSPDGTRLAFWRTTADHRTELVITNDAGSLERVIAIPRGSVDYSGGIPGPAWSPDGRRLAVAIDDAGFPSIWTVDSDGTGLRRLTPLSIAAQDPAWSPDGRRLAFHGGGGFGPANGIYAINSDGTGAHQVSHVVGHGFAFESPQWQPGGDLIAYTGFDDGRHDIFVVHADGSGERDVSNNPADEFWPAWSPDGLHLAFVRVGDGAANQIIVVAPDGSDARALLNPIDAGSLVWSPDGRQIAESSSGTDAWATAFFDIVGQRPPIIRRGSGLANLGIGTWQRLPP